MKIPTADSIVTKILQRPKVIATLPAERVQGDETNCKHYLLELYDQRQHVDTMTAFLGEKLFKEIIWYVETYLQ